VYGLQQNLAVVCYTECLGIKNGDADSDESEHAQQIYPVKPTDIGVPYVIGFKIGHGGTPVVYVHCFLVSEQNYYGVSLNF
jgi:hypothetical protein